MLGYIIGALYVGCGMATLFLAGRAGVFARSHDEWGHSDPITTGAFLFILSPLLLPMALGEMSRKSTASVGRNPEGQDAQRLDAEHEHAVGEAETPTRSRQSNKPGREM